MYCKYCGKEIADDSKFCQHCGKNQQSIDNENSKDVAPIDIIVTKLFSNLNKKNLLVYIIWAVLNLILLCYGERGRGLDYFYPFTPSGFQLCYYDSTEFITYVILAPLLILFYFKYWHEPLKKKVQEWNKKSK